MIDYLGAFVYVKALVELTFDFFVPKLHHSGKTLAFLIPVLEVLYRHRFSPSDGCGAAILSPTRELAMQIYTVLRSVGQHHTVSVGLLIGGKKDFHEEQEMVGNTNLIIATPGRLLQHLEQTPYFDMSELKILVLDEADRILDMGFRDQLMRILKYLPAVVDGDPMRRQTLLFSATQTRDVKQLATLSLNKPEYLGVHDNERQSTPEGLKQSYVVVPLEHKLNAVYSFIKTHLKSKTILFMASCAQVRHAWELFCSLRPGVVVMALHGKLAQSKRTQIYFDFLQRPHAVLFATDIASRGLDFKAVDWVVNVDAPEDRDMYIHRVGRTARYKAGGKSLLLLTPAEDKKGYIQYLQGKNASKLPLHRLNINPNRTVIVTNRAAAMVASNVNLHKLAKKAYQSYVRSIYLMPDKEIFNVNDLPLEAYGESLGLDSIPNTSRFMKALAKDRAEYREGKNVNRKLQKLKEQIKAEKLAKKLAKLGENEKTAVKAKSTDSADSGSDSDSDDDVIVKTNRVWTDDGEPLPEAGVNQVTKSTSKSKSKKIRIEGSNANNKHVIFNDNGEEEDVGAFMRRDSKEIAEAVANEKKELKGANDEFMQTVRKRLERTVSQDRADEKERVRLKHKKRRLQEKGEKDESDEEGGAVVMLGTSDDRESDSASSSAGSSSSSGSDSDSSDDDDDNSVDLKAQEDKALSLIRGA